MVKQVEPVQVELQTNFDLHNCVSMTTLHDDDAADDAGACDRIRQHYYARPQPVLEVVLGGGP